MRLLIKAGAKTAWTTDQADIALGETPHLPETGAVDPFLFACAVGNINAVIAYVSRTEVGRRKKPEAVIAAVEARAADIVAWLMDKGFDPNAPDDIYSGALEKAVNNDDVATAEVLLTAGADLFGSPKRDYSSPMKCAVSEPMRVLFVRYGVNPTQFRYATTPETVPLPFLPQATLTQEEFELHRSPQKGRRNPERFLPKFWHEQMRTGRYSAPRDIAHNKDRTKPIWTFSRYGRSATPLPDGRLVLVAGEHEDSYDPDFYIYADVTVLDGKGGVDHYIYPEEVFPPTDFHSATLLNNHIWLIGSLGYPKGRQEGVTQVLRLDLTDFSIHPIATTGDAPGWISRHQAVLDPTGIILIGGKIIPGYRDNEETYLLDLDTFIWRKIA